METDDELDPNTKRKIKYQDIKDKKNEKRRKTNAKNKERNKNYCDFL
jgi:hypothetical protein